MGRGSPCPDGRLRTHAAELGCGIMPRVSFNPSGRDRGCEDSHAAGPAQRRSGERRGCCQRPPRLSIPGPPQTSKRGGFSAIDFLCGIRFPGRRLAGPPAAPKERKPLKRQKESAKSHSAATAANFSHSLIRAQAFFPFQPRGLLAYPGETPVHVNSRSSRWA